LFTGERLDPRLSLGTQIYQLHHSRYIFATNHADSKHVLDLACGTGYGSAELATRAKLVVAADISDSTLHDAKTNYGCTNIEFLVTNALNLSLNSKSLHLVVAFEMIEHMPAPDRCLEEIRRVLIPGGKLIISAPNRAIHSPGRRKPLHKWHHFEPTVEEFRALLENAGFHIESLMGQNAQSNSGTSLKKSKRNPLIVSAVKAGQMLLPITPKWLQRVLLNLIRDHRLFWRMLPSYQPALSSDISFDESRPDLAMNLIAVCSVPH